MRNNVGDSHGDGERSSDKVQAVLSPEIYRTPESFNKLDPDRGSLSPGASFKELELSSA